MPPYEGRRRRLRYHLCSRWWSLHRHSLQTTPRTRRGHGWRRCLAWWAGLWNDAALTSSGRGPRRRRLAQRRGVSRGGAHGRHRQQRRRLRGDGQSRRGHGRCCRRWRRLGGDRALRQGRRRLLGWHSHSKTRGCLDRRWLLRRHHSRRRRHRRRRRNRLHRRRNRRSRRSPRARRRWWCPRRRRGLLPRGDRVEALRCGPTSSPQRTRHAASASARSSSTCGRCTAIAPSSASERTTAGSDACCGASRHASCSRRGPPCDPWTRCPRRRRARSLARRSPPCGISRGTSVEALSARSSLVGRRVAPRAHRSPKARPGGCRQRGSRCPGP
mmetsp:Transcript_60312/g.197317  ORF Transcript_60312/g.197317 Transcript_60312/m.197317 type:complete len:329 (-) Transcript_60312:4169-5155(-)